MAIIYKITNPNGRIYIGQTTNIKTRWGKYSKLHCIDQPSLYLSLKKYGWENHTKKIIEECKVEDLDSREIYWGEYYDVLSNKHLNNRLGRGFGSYDSEETKRKKSECHLGRENYWLKGKTLTNEHKEKISKAKKGHDCYNNEWRKNHQEGILNRNFVVSEQHKQAIIKSKSKPIVQYSKDGKFIKEFPSGKIASNILNIPQSNINANCNNRIKSAGGFVFKFKTR